MKRLWLTTLLLSLSFIVTRAENSVYWISFSNKVNTKHTIKNPDTYLSDRAIERRSKFNIPIDSLDLPVSTTYIDSLKALGFTTYKPSKWLNGVMIEANTTVDIENYSFPSFVTGKQLIKEYSSTKSTIQKNTINKKISVFNSTFSGYSDTQINIHNGEDLHKVATADGIHIAVIDGGFYNADTDPFFDKLRDRDGILGTYDLVKNSESIFSNRSDYHGAYVLSTMAGYIQDDYKGTAPDASYWLIRSEDVDSEYLIEEYNWVIAAEFADSVGTDIINSSLGYYEFDNSDMNYTTDDMDGKTTISSQGANIAFAKGIIVVTSAGNEGNDAWGYVVAPSEAKHVVSVGAIKSDSTLAYFSSYGFESGNHELKPNIVALGYGAATTNTSGKVTYANGTSFSSPIACGLIACLIQLYPQKTPQEIVDMIYSISDRYPAHSLEFGYGIPDFKKLDKVSTTALMASRVKCYPNPFSSKIQVKNVSTFQTINIFSSTGRMIYSESINNRSEVIITCPENLPQGMYIISIDGKSGKETFKMTLQ